MPQLGPQMTQLGPQMTQLGQETPQLVSDKELLGDLSNPAIVQDG